jgi:hypothetical protein
VALSDATSGSAAELLQQVRNHLAGRNPAAAYALLQIAVVHHEDDPFLISYYGYLRAARDGSFKSGIEDCSRALWLYQRRLLRGVGGDDERLKAVLYLNLGRANLAAGKRKDAYDALAKGMLLDLGNDEIIEELGRMGIRKRKPVPFLGRSNPINNFIGRMLRKPEDLPPPRI